jgi:hypothetical protein
MCQTGNVSYMLSIQIHPRYSRNLRTHARRPLRLFTSSQRTENTPKTACRRCPASRCASSSSRERASRRGCAHTSSTDPPRPSGPPPTASCDGVWRQQPPVVEAELHLLHVDDLLQPPVAPQRAALAAGWRGERVRLRRRVPEASSSSDGLPTPAPSAVPFPSSLSPATQARPAWSLSRGSDERPCVPRR